MISDLEGKIRGGSLRYIEDLLEEQLELLKEHLTIAVDYEKIRFLQGQAFAKKELLALLNKAVSR